MIFNSIVLSDKIAVKFGSSAFIKPFEYLLIEEGKQAVDRYTNFFITTTHPEGFMVTCEQCKAHFIPLEQVFLWVYNIGELNLILTILQNPLLQQNTQVIISR